MPEAQSQHHQDTRQTEAGPQPMSQTHTAHPKECTLRPREKLATWELVKPGIKGNSATSKGLASHPILLSRCRVTSPQPLWAPSREVWSAAARQRLLCSGASRPKATCWPGRVLFPGLRGDSPSSPLRLSVRRLTPHRLRPAAAGPLQPRAPRNQGGLPCLWPTSHMIFVCFLLCAVFC